MPAKSLIVQSSARKKLLKFPAHIHKKVIHTLTRIQQNPMIGVKLKGELVDYFKYRIGDYRIVYKCNKKESRIEVVKVEHRQGVYK